MVRQIVRSISHKHSDSKCQCIDQDKLVLLLEFFQHVISFTIFSRQCTMSSRHLLFKLRIMPQFWKFHMFYDHREVKKDFYLHFKAWL
jgi:hypothetical protein